MVMQPPCQVAPIAALIVLIRKPGNDDGRPGYRLLPFSAVPDVAFLRMSVARAVEAVLIAIPVEIRRAIAGPNSDTAKGLFQRVHQRGTKSAPILKNQIRIFRHVRNAMKPVDLGKHEVAHEIVPGQALPTKGLKAPHAGRFAHQPKPFQRKAPSSDKGEKGLKATSQIWPSGSAK